MPWTPARPAPFLAPRTPLPTVAVATEEFDPIKPCVVVPSVGRIGAPATPGEARMPNAAVDAPEIVPVAAASAADGSLAMVNTAAAAVAPRTLVSAPRRETFDSA